MRQRDGTGALEMDYGGPVVVKFKFLRSCRALDLWKSIYETTPIDPREEWILNRFTALLVKSCHQVCFE